MSICFRTRFLATGLTLLALAVPAAAVRATQWQAGYRTLNTSAGVDTPATHIAIWYPTRQRERIYREGAFTMQVAAKAPLSAGRFPVVALSHGAFGRPINHRDLAIALARNGYIVVAPQHDPGADAAGFGSARQRDGRPRELLSALLTVRSQPDFAAHFDSGRIGAIGYSAGGYAVLAAMGARSRWINVIGHCLLHYISDYAFCHGGSGGLPASSKTTSRPVAVGKPLSAQLSIRSAVLLAPVAAVFSSEGLVPIRVPVRIHAPDNDQMLNARWHGRWLHDVLKAQETPVELVVTHAGHYVFMSGFPESIRTEAGVAAEDPPGFDRAAFQRKLARDTIEFFGRTLQHGNTATSTPL